MTYFEDALREMICQELNIPNIQCRISSDKNNNDMYVEYERQVQQVMRQMVQFLFYNWKVLFNPPTRAVPSVECDGSKTGDSFCVETESHKEE